jgi:hypothetical protein
MGQAARAPIAWAPQPGPQAALVKCPVYEILYGGARGGGKTDGMLGKFAIKQKRYGRYAKGIFFRRELPQLEAAIQRSKEIYFQMGAEWREQPKTWLFPNGATLKFRPLERDTDAEKYQGHDYTDVMFEELTNFPDPKPVMKMHGVLRSGSGVPCQMHGTANPGGPGHTWVKARYIDPAPLGWKIITDENGLERVYIPARVSDNRILMENDPAYVARLRQTGSAALVKAWLEGNWDVVEGAFFDCWHPSIVVPPVALPDYWTRFGSFDWGSARPFSFGWWAVSDGELSQFPRGALVRYREWYGAAGPNVGLKLTAEEVALGILSRMVKGEALSYVAADPATKSEDGGPSIAERMMRVGLKGIVGADNKRVPGWDQMRQRMVGLDGRPMVYCFSTCVDSIRTIPSVQHDQRRPEDVDTESEDHAADEWRYGLMSRPWVRPAPIVEPPRRVMVGGKSTVTVKDTFRLGNDAPKERF